MASSVLQVRVEEGLRAQAAAIYEDLGIDLQTAVRIFLKRSVRDNGLPFGMTLSEKKESYSESMMKVMREMSEEAKQAGVSDMSLDEINAEIAAARAERRARKSGDSG
ncbi:MAG: type II toxin-antitoxin system RelB/DinJ family antitoxin [Oscillospiraceae bacterium]|nr:type II toxin-antitoxin system RelB/DinJ family antitoxin [Oscillospiraceae bacterium]